MEATVTTSIIGTPNYMSPEQIECESDKLDGRSDIYSLGIVLFEMLAGVLPYQADTPTKILVMHLNERVPDISKFRPDLPRDCDGIIAKAMAKKAKERYASASDLITDLCRITKGDGLAERITSGGLYQNIRKIISALSLSDDDTRQSDTLEKSGLGKGIKMGGSYNDRPLSLIAAEWKKYAPRACYKRMVVHSQKTESCRSFF